MNATEQQLEQLFKTSISPESFAIIQEELSKQNELELTTTAIFCMSKVLKENTGKTTTVHIANRVVNEAKILLKQTDWSISEIAWCLGFEEVAHFSNFFRKQTSFAPIGFRS